MCRLTKSGTVLFLVVVLVMFPVSALAQPKAMDANLTANWGLEDPYNVYGTYGGYNLSVANNWHRFPADSEPKFMRSSDYAAMVGGVNEKTEGSNSQNFWSQAPFTAGVYQQVGGVTVGKAYGAKASILTIYQTSASRTHGKMFKQVGIDPYGGTDPNSPNVVWGEQDGDDVYWRDMRAAAIAKATTITVFARVLSPEAVAGVYLNQVFIDAIVVAEAPTVSASSPPQAPSTFEVAWTNGQFAPGGTGDPLQYDVQWKDNAGTDWTKWHGKASGTSDTFGPTLPPTRTEPLVVGHTYYFRARAWQKYKPEGIRLHGPWPDGYDTATLVGSRPIEGYVLTNREYPVQGATVSISGTAVSGTSDTQGYYNLNPAASGTYTLEVSHSDYEAPPWITTNYVTTIGSNVTFIMKPWDDAVTNGDFENGLSGWTPSCTGTFTVTRQARSGAYSLVMSNTMTNTCRLSQLFPIREMYEPMYEPTLSFWYSAALSSGGGVTVSAHSNFAPARVFSTAQSSGWTHQWLVLAEGGTYSGTVEISFDVVGPAVVYLDEVSLGGGEHPFYVDLPILLLNYTH